MWTLEVPAKNIAIIGFCKLAKPHIIAQIAIKLRDT